MSNSVNSRLSWLRPSAQIVAVVGAIWCVATLIGVGKRQSSMLLIVLFSAWVAAPFLLLLIADAVARTWPEPQRVRLAEFTALGCLIAVALLVQAPLATSRPVPYFVIVPPCFGAASLFLVLLLRRHARHR